MSKNQSFQISSVRAHLIRPQAGKAHEKRIVGNVFAFLRAYFFRLADPLLILSYDAAAPPNAPASCSPVITSKDFILGWSRRQEG